MPEFFADPCLALAQRAPQAIIGRDAGGVLTHAAFMRRVGAWYGVAAGVSGRQLALYLDNSVEFAAALVAAWQCGKTVWLCADTLDASCASMAASVDAFAGDFPAAYSPLRPAMHDHDVPLLHALEPDFAALVVHTSGTTGAAQAIPKRMAQLTAEVATLETQFGASLGDAEIVSTVSHHHIYGLLFRIMWPLAAGRVMYAHTIAYPEQLGALLGARACALIASPAHLKRLPPRLDFSGCREHLRAVFSSGGMLDAEVAQTAATLLGHAPIEVYGSSETGGIAWRVRQTQSRQAWQALPGVAWRIADDGDTLEVQSPHIGQRNWLRLADRAQACGDGFVLLGRSDRIVKIEEKRVSLDAIEAALAASTLVRDVRVIMDTELSGQRQRLAAFVVPGQAGRALLAAGGRRALNARLRLLLVDVVPAVAVPRRWRYPEQLPVNAQGKTTHAQLLALLDLAHDEQLPAAPIRPPAVACEPQLREAQARMLERDGQRVVLELTVPASLTYFDGHFAGAPVLPGVVQVDWAILFGRRHFALAPVFAGMRALKFQQPIVPGKVVMLELVHAEQKKCLTFRYFSSAGQHAGGRILFRDGAANV